jgi:hypothetical protein
MTFKVKVKINEEICSNCFGGNKKETIFASLFKRTALKCETKRKQNNVSGV